MFSDFLYETQTAELKSTESKETAVSEVAGRRGGCVGYFSDWARGFRGCEKLNFELKWWVHLLLAGGELEFASDT